MKKYITDMTTEDLRRVFAANDQLQQDISDDMYDSEMYYAREILSCWSRSAIDYCIGYDDGCFFKWCAASDFIKGLQEAQKNYGFLPDDANNTIDYVSRLLGRLNIPYLSMEDEDRIIERVQGLCDDLAAECDKTFRAMFDACFDAAYAEDYFLDFYADERLEPDCYIETDDGDFILYEEIYKVKRHNNG